MTVAELQTVDDTSVKSKQNFTQVPRDSKFKNVSQKKVVRIQAWDNESLPNTDFNVRKPEGIKFTDVAKPVLT